MIDGEKYNINDGNLTDCADITYLKNVSDELITTDIYACNSTDCADDVTGGLISDIDAGDSTDYGNIQI